MTKGIKLVRSVYVFCERFQLENTPALYTLNLGLLLWHPGMFGISARKVPTRTKQVASNGCWSVGKPGKLKCHRDENYFPLGRRKVQRGHADSRLLVLLSLVDDLASGQRYFRASVLRSNTRVVLDIVLETIERNVILLQNRAYGVSPFFI